MQIIESEMIVFYDVDDTLVMWDDNSNQPTRGRIKFIDPYNNDTVWLKVHYQHYNLMLKHKAQGYTIFVWSAGGYLWAKEVVNKLNLQGIVDFVMSKPMKFVDDLPAKEIMGTRVYIPFNHIKKDSNE